MGIRSDVISTHSIGILIIGYLSAISIRPDSRKNVYFFLILWFAVSINLFVDYPNIFIAFPAIVYALFQAFDIKKDGRKTTFSLKLYPFWSMIIMIPILALFVAYNLQVYKKPVALTNTYNLQRLRIQGIQYTDQTLSNDLFTKKSYTSRFNILGIFNGIRVLVWSSDRGLLFYSPIYLLTIIGFVIAIRRRDWRIILALAMFAFDVFVYGAFDDPYGGWAFGPRYLIPTIPLLAFVAAYAFDKINKNTPTKILIALLTLFSIFTSLAGALTTNAIPPKIEAVGLHMKYNFTNNLDMLAAGRSGSYVYNTYLHKFMSPVYLFIVLFIIAGSVTLGLIFSAKTRKSS